MSKRRASRGPGRPPRSDDDGTDKPLGRESICKAALQLIDQHGLAAFNMRDLAKALAVAPAALYWHVPSRVDLFSGVVALALSEVADIRANDSWQAALRRIIFQFRDVLRRHPGLAPLVATQLVSNIPADAQRMNQILLALEDAGFAGRGLVDAFNVVVVAMCGFAALELSSASSDETESLKASYRRHLASLDRARLPGLARNATALADNAFMFRWSSGMEKPLDRSFGCWVDVIIGGLEARLQSASGPTRGSGRRPLTGA